jgi:2-C-methyl-D-erythritol 2,4-cyclodiphosphate synthase
MWSNRLNCFILMHDSGSFYLGWRHAVTPTHPLLQQVFPKAIMAKIFRVGLGHDTHRLVEGRPLILGGIRIENSLGLLGHSDADIVLHSVADALLGAAGLGDIGEHFPDTSPECKDLDSSILLAKVVADVKAKGWSVVNADIIIHAQAPKLLPYKPLMRARIAELLGVGIDLVNLKAKTGEKVGPVGRLEAMQAEAIVLLEKDSAE